MKKAIALFMFLFCSFMLMAQTGYRTANSNGLPGEVSAEQVSLHNAWFGSSFSYTLTGDADFNENFLFNANILYDIEFGDSGWHFPVVGEIQLPTTGGTLEDVEVGLYPWKVLTTSANGIVVVGHGGASYIVKPQDEVGNSPQSFKILAGAEVSIPLGNSNLPLTVSATPTFQTFNLERDSQFGLEGTVIFPIASNLGVIGEVYAPFKSDVGGTQFSAGVLVNGAIGK